MLRVEIKRLDEKIDSVRNELKAEIKRVEEKVDFALDKLVKRKTSVNLFLNGSWRGILCA